MGGCGWAEDQDRAGRRLLRCGAWGAGGCVSGWAVVSSQGGWVWELCLRAESGQEEV